MAGIDELKRKLRPIFERRGVVVAYLFGSVAEGRDRPDSDVDIAVLLPRSIGEREMADLQISLILEIGGALGRDDVDVVVLNRAPLELRYQVLKHGIPLYCSDEGERIDFEALTLSMYYDYKYYTDRYYREMLRRIEEGRFGGLGRRKGSDQAERA